MRLRADAAPGHVHDAREADDIERVVDEAQVGEHILHLAPLVEARAADELVRDGRADERLLQRAGLRVRAVHHGDVAVAMRPSSTSSSDLARDEVGLLRLVVRLVHDDRLAGALVGPERLLLALLVAGDDGVRGVEDGLRRAVVLFEQDDARFGKVALEVEDVADVGGAPRVDRLVGVADDADVAVLAGEQPRELVLGDVRVLELVDQDVQEALLVLLAHVVVVAEQLDRLHDHVVEVEGVVLGKQILVARRRRARRPRRSSRAPRRRTSTA